MRPVRLPSWLRRLLRQQRRSAGATGLIVSTLALALGANTAMFSIANALLVRAVPFPGASRLVAVSSAFPTVKLTGMGLSGPEALELAELTTTLAASGPYSFTGLVVQGGNEAELASGAEVSRGAVAALAISPTIGRPFSDADFATGGAPVVILGQGLWIRAFGGDPGVIGRSVPLGGISREVIGVLPRGITLLNRQIDLWIPLALEKGRAGGRSDHRFNVVARLAPGRTESEAVADVRRATDIWREETGEMHVPHPRMHPLEVRSLTVATTGLNREPVTVLLVAVALVLLIACANVSNLLVARLERRRADLAIQLALGATQRHLVAVALSEGLALAAASAVGGLACAAVLLDLVRANWPTAAAADLSIDFSILAATAAITAAAGLVIGIAPVARLDLSRASDWLKSRGPGGAPRGWRVQRALVMLQIALAVPLAVCAGLMARSLMALTAVDTGIQPQNVVRAQVSLPAGAYPNDVQVWTFYDRVLERLQATPGVSVAAAMSGLPPQRRANNTSFLLDGVETIDHSALRQVDFVQHVSTGYLQALAIPLLEGRAFAATDDERAAPVALVNETLARSFWPGESAIGHRLKPAGNIGTWFTVIGVVADVRQNGLQSPPGTEVYVPHKQARMLMSGFMPRTMNVIVRRASTDTAAAAAHIRSAVRDVDPAAAVADVVSMQAIVDRSIAQPRLLAWTFAAFALLSLAVAAVGVYAVTSFAVGTRTAEFGVRMALGARPADVMRLVVSGGLLVVAAGLATGMVATVSVAALLRNLLFNVQPLDSLSLAASVGVISIAALFALLVPAGRAARVDPIAALRE